MKQATIVFLIAVHLYMHGHEHEQLKLTIDERKNALLHASDKEKSGIYYDLALAYHQDQESDQAFICFLEALKRCEKFPSIEMSADESLLYTKALTDYLSHCGSEPVKAAQKMLQEYGEIAEINRHFLHFNFLIATAYANLGKYEAFFDRFYQGFPYLHDTFLAYKTQGILYLRLGAHGKSSEERMHYKEEAFHYLTLALDRNPRDPGLYKVLIFIAKDEKNNALVLNYLKKILEHKVEIARSDICLYVREAATLEEFELAQQIINQARIVYDYSRSISAAQEYLNQYKNVCKSE